MSNVKDTQSRKWMLVINNPEEHGLTIEKIIELLNLFHPDYFCLAAEISSTGTYHIHIFLYSTSPMRFYTVKKRFPTAHIEKANGTCHENRDYIRKEGKWADTAKAETRVGGTFQEFGTLPNESEEKSPKMAQLIQYIKDGLTNLEIIEIDPSYGFKTREIDLLRQQLLEEKYTRENQDVIVHYIYGDSGTGKTRSIFDKHPDRHLPHYQLSCQG